ncbi:STAS domain-containing protein [Streptomyces bikiniensis]|uniref:STAS domain-containing protein n=1 Tax=Streptomyces bikiniensis TaxID=1896 RepID=UPI0005266863|nr:STAS domain-containing protein [Streptomyces bikiniensis]
MLHVTTRAGDRVTALLPESVDLHTVPLLRAVGNRIIDEGCRHLTLDASRSRFLDSSGITLLINWYQRLDRIDGSLSLAGVNADIHGLLHRLGLDTVIVLIPRAPAPDPPGP